MEKLRVKKQKGQKIAADKSEFYTHLL